MNLGFMQEWPKEMAMSDSKTYFIEKINLGLLQQNIIKRIDYVDTLEDHRSKFNSNWDIKHDLFPKLHTIRRDEENRWKADMNIHFVVNGRTKDRFQFAPVVKCISVQDIEIIYSVDKSRPLILKVDDVDYNPFGFTAEKIARNDGFESVEDFFKYFNKDFKGKLLHWTNLKY